MHLRSINPYVASAIGEWGKAHGTAAHIPLQAAPAPSTDSALPFAGELLFSTAHFGMQKALKKALNRLEFWKHCCNSVVYS